jgi:S-DNA-T family DNA segregation ATPase FtsK/SpoIIIE
VETRAHPERPAPSLEELHEMLATREAVFRDNAIDSPGWALRRLGTRRGSDPLSFVPADIVLPSFLIRPRCRRTGPEELEELLADLLQRGGRFDPCRARSQPVERTG